MDAHFRNTESNRMYLRLQWGAQWANVPCRVGAQNLAPPPGGRGRRATHGQPGLSIMALSRGGLSPIFGFCHRRVFRTNYACVVDRVVRGVGWIGHVIQGTGGMRNVNHSAVLHNIVPVLSLSRGRGPSINNRRPGTNIYHKGRVGWCAVKNVVKVVMNVIIFVCLVRVISNIVRCARICLPGSPGHLG